MGTTTIESTYKPIHLYIKYQRNELFITKCKKPTGDGTSMLHSTIDWVSQISLQLITPVPYSKHECGISSNTSITINLGLPEVKAPQPVIPPHSRKSLTITNWSLSKLLQDTKVFSPTKAPRIVTQSHIFLGYIAFVQPRLQDQ